jgi:hypothetical protein
MITIKNGFFLGLLWFIPVCSWSGWPIFSVPDIAAMKAAITSDGCEPGFSRLDGSHAFPIQIYQQTWYWQLVNNNVCQRITQSVDHLKLIASYASGRKTGHVIIASYGLNSNEILFNFAFQIPSCSQGPEHECQWECAPFDNKEALSSKFWCAADM